MYAWEGSSPKAVIIREYCHFPHSRLQEVFPILIQARNHSLCKPWICIIERICSSYIHDLSFSSSVEHGKNTRKGYRRRIIIALQVHASIIFVKSGEVASNDNCVKSFEHKDHPHGYHRSEVSSQGKSSRYDSTPVFELHVHVQHFFKVVTMVPSWVFQGGVKDSQPLSTGLLFKLRLPIEKLRENIYNPVIV